VPWNGGSLRFTQNLAGYVEREMQHGGPRIEDEGMKPRITLITLGVDNLERALAFYRDGLGLETQGIVGEEFDHGAVAFFQLQNGVGLALWPRKSLSRDTGLPETPRSATEFALAHNVWTEGEVDQVMEEARLAGGKIVKPAGETFYGGYAGYFQDPDGHLWEVAWNPQILPEERTDEA